MVRRDVGCRIWDWGITGCLVSGLGVTGLGLRVVIIVCGEKSIATQHTS